MSNERDKLAPVGGVPVMTDEAQKTELQKVFRQAMRDAGKSDEEIAKLEENARSFARRHAGAVVLPPRKTKASVYFDEIELAPLEERTVTGRIEERIRLFRGTLLTVRESDERATYIVGLEIARRQQMPPNQGGVLSFFFSQRALSSGFRYDTLDTLTGFARITVRNASLQPVKWSAEIEGDAITHEAYANAR